jgi:hypothetical protein
VRRVAVALCVLTSVATAAAGIGTALASRAGRGGPFAHRGHAGLSAAQVRAGTGAMSTRVIVVLRNQLGALPSDRTHIRHRIQGEGSADAAIKGDIARSGGRIYMTYHGLNAFAAKVSARERTALAGNAQVAQVIPDTVVTLPTNDTGTANPTAAPGTVGNAQQLCPADSSKPLLEPEALQTTHTAYSDPTIPQAQNLATGTGVKVAFFADGVDVNNPDFIRPDGSHVFVDYQDFTGEGPNAPSDAREGFGDASSIAAQGNQTYDISQYMNPAHPLPPGCNIKVRGVAPGASLIGIKVFGNSNSAYNSVILQGLDYALTNDHPDVISESFGGYPIPDSTQDLTRQFNEQAVAAGTVVVESSGDSGVRSSPSSASSDPAVISAGASTTFQNYAQGTQYGYQFSSGGWQSDNISSIESAGFTQAGRVVDLVAPGEANWALCSPNSAVYLGCANFAGQPSGLQSFGGTSESAPLIAGGAALVIQAYRQSHGGASPSPELVRQLLTSTATDLHAPSAEQGAGELNTLAAVQAAQALGNPGGGDPAASTAGAPAGQGPSQSLLVDQTQLDLSGEAGSPFSRDVRVTNLGSTTQVVHAQVRALTTQLSNQAGSVTLDGSSPTFVDQFGQPRPYAKLTFTVPAGADRLDTFLAWNGPTSRVGLTLLDPSGKFAAYTRPQGDGNHGEVDVQEPAAGTWTAIIFRRDGTFTGPVQWQATTQQFGSVDSVSPATASIPPGESQQFTVSSNFPAQAGDSSQDLVFTPSSGGPTVVPIALRSLIATGSAGGSFSGNLIGGNGRGGAYQPGQLDTYDFQVPAGEPELTASVSFTGDPDTQIIATLINPTGQAVTGALNSYIDGTGTQQFTNGLEAYVPSPRPGLWRLVIDVVNPTGGTALSAPYSGTIGFAPPPVTTSGLPNSAHVRLKAGQPATFTVNIANNGAGTEQVFLDPRTPQHQQYSLLSQTPATGLTLPISGNQLPPLFLVPTETHGIQAFAQASAPVTFDFGYGDPDIAAISSGNSASGSFTGVATPGLWSLAPDLIGPFSGRASSASANTGMVADTLGFDPSVSSSTGDVWEQAVDPNAAAFTPITLAPGQTGSATVTITPAPGHRRLVRGTLFVDVFNNVLALGGEVVGIPYEYSVAR